MLNLNQFKHEFILLINVKMSTIVGILTFINTINISSACFKQDRNHYFSVFYFLLTADISCSVELSMKSFKTSEPGTVIVLNFKYFSLSVLNKGKVGFQG